MIALLCVAVGFAWLDRKSWEQTRQSQQQQSSVEKTAGKGGLDSSKPQSLWVPTDSVGLYTLVLSVFTGVLACVSIFQGFMLLRADKSTRISAETSAELVRLGREEFIASHRPRILVYGLGFFGAASGNDEVEGPIRICFRYVNSGDSPANIKTIATKLVHLVAPRMPSEIKFELEEIEPPMEIKSGHHGFRLTVEEFDQPKFIFNSAADIYRLVCVGVIVYADSSGTDRQMGFCRWYDSESNRWIAMDDPEYEYSY